MRPAVRVTAAALVVAVLAGAGIAVAFAHSSGSSATPGPTHPPIVGGTSLVVPTPGMSGVRPIGWDRVVPSTDGTTITVWFWSGVAPCSQLDHVGVGYGTSTVTITLYQGSDPNAGRVACPDIAEHVRTVVTLTQPLAGRTIVDGAR